MATTSYLYRPTAASGRQVGLKWKMSVKKRASIRTRKMNRKAAVDKRKKTIERKQAVRNKIDDEWYKHLALVLRYQELHGDINVPVTEVMSDEGVQYNIGEWLNTQRELLQYFRMYEFEKYDVLLSLNESAALDLELETDNVPLPLSDENAKTTPPTSSSSSQNHSKFSTTARAAPTHNLVKPIKNNKVMNNKAMNNDDAPRKARSTKQSVSYTSGSSDEDQEDENDPSIAPQKLTTPRNQFIVLKSTKSQFSSKKQHSPSHKFVATDDSTRSDQSVIVSEDSDECEFIIKNHSSSRKADAKDSSKKTFAEDI